MNSAPNSVGTALPGEMRVAPAIRSFSIAIAYSRTPLPMTRADQMTVAHLIAFLAARGHRVDFYGLESGEAMTAAEQDWLAAHCRRVNIVPHGRGRRLWGLVRGLVRGLPLQVGWFLNEAQSAAIRDGMDDVDIAYCYYIRSAETLRGQRGRKITILAMQLSQSLNTRRMMDHYRNFRERMIYRIESRLVRNYEATVWRDFTRTILIGEKDAEEIRSICRETGLPEIDNVFFAAHGVDTKRFAPRENVTPEPYSLIFNGVLRTYTNVQAITWFVANVWPLIRDAEPRATLMIVGRDPRPEVRALGSADGITVTGEVPDPADYIARAAICIDPVHAGAGMQNKLIEFLAMGKPVVATWIANEGIGARPGRDLLLADAPQEMADAILGLFNDPGRAAEIGEAARQFAEQSWSWEAHFLKLEAEMLRLLEESPAQNG